MKSLLFPVAFCIAVSVAAPPAEAQAGVHDGSSWKGGGSTISVGVTYVGDQMTLQTVTAGGFTNPANGVPAEGSSVQTPVAASSNVMTAPDGGKYKAENGVMWRWSEGKWRPMKRTFRRSPKIGSGGHGPGDGSPGEEVVTLPFWAPDPASWDATRN